ncbi:MAG: hypothetical protein DRH79_02000 [Candidatus Cloacimonadota bacterium]|nr:MAG: hypothetical protein DRH79_02000 [Candidatus Cloacimonadota bacterium]
MKKTMLVVLVIFISILSADIIKDIDDWTTQQHQPFDAKDVATFMNGRPGGNINYGVESVFNNATTNYTSATSLDATHFVVAYRDDGNSFYGTAIVGTVSGNTISYGAEYIFNTATSTTYISSTSLDATHFVVAYRDSGNPSTGKAIVGTVSGSTISFGTGYVFNNSDSSDISATSLDATHFVVAYRDYGSISYGTAIVGTVSGSTISYGAEYVFEYNSSSDISATSLDATHFVVSYLAGYGTAIVGTVSGSTISYGVEYIFTTGSNYDFTVTSLDATHFVIVYKDGGNSDYGTAMVGTVSGSSITYGAESVFSTAYFYNFTVTSLDATHFVVAYSDAGNSDYGTAIVGTVSGSTISYGAESVFNNTLYSLDITVTSLDATHFVIAYRDYGNSDYGTAIVGEIGGTLPNSAVQIFPADTAAEMPQQVTVNWNYTARDNPTGFYVYKGGAVVADVVFTAPGAYTHVFAGLVWNEVVSWKVEAYNSAGSAAADVRTFTVMSEPANPGATPTEIVYTEIVDFTGLDPAPLELPIINLGGNVVAPIFDLDFSPETVTNFTILAEVADQPNHPLANPQNCSAAFRSNFPSGIAVSVLFDFGGAQIPNQLMRWNGGNWEDISGLATFGAGTVLFVWTSSTRGEEEFAVNNGDGPLPVTLSSFTAVQTTENFARLNWITQSESGLIGYNIYRNVNEIQSFMQINPTIIAGTNSSEEQHYTFTDPDVEYEQTYHYWLESVGMDYHTELFGPITLSIESPIIIELPNASILRSAYPNPFNPTTTIEFDIKENEKGTIIIYNIKGRVILKETFDPGNHTFEWNADKYSSGVYFYKLQTNSYSKINKMLMLK